MLATSFARLSMRSLQRHCSAAVVAEVPAALPIPKLSVVRHPYPINGVPIGTNPEDDKRKFAVIKISGTQYKVAAGDILHVDNMTQDLDEEVSINEVLLVGSRVGTVIGHPLLPNAKVTAVVEEKLKDAKVIIFKKRRRKHSQRLRGFRRRLTVLRVSKIDFDHPALE